MGENHTYTKRSLSLYIFVPIRESSTILTSEEVKANRLTVIILEPFHAPHRYWGKFALSPESTPPQLHKPTKNPGPMLVSSGTNHKKLHPNGSCSFSATPTHALTRRHSAQTAQNANLSAPSRLPLERQCCRNHWWPRSMSLWQSSGSFDF